ncbi:alpha/beta fold hydrolase [Leptospira barantonii]|uniref:Alpha/beta hydrolase n=1 Tax=Leptospira barantonii TaxID=2023184 RepID=A0ABX4NMC6_9LEPT|nr:alpha/beta hydrolase [Leptospira barantonii]PJZ57893.1 alpha/beta hydrolase [Leptospira barantonii]
MLHNRSLFYFSLIFLFLIGISCRVPEDLKKKSEESLVELKESGAEYKELFLESKGKNIYAVASGCESEKENILIFIHGSPGGWQNYAWYLENKKLTEKYCILSLDRPGFGKSDPNEVVADVEKQAVILNDAIGKFSNSIRKNETLKITLVGHSYGGPIAARIASISENKIHVLVLLAAPLSSQEEEIQWYNKIADWNWVKGMLPQEIRNSNDEMLPLKPQLFSLEPFWKKISCKTILIHGKEDSLVPFQNLEYFQNQLPKSQLLTITLDEENHFIPWTQKNLLEKTFLDLVK